MFKKLITLDFKTLEVLNVLLKKYINDETLIHFINDVDLAVRKLDKEVKLQREDKKRCFTERYSIIESVISMKCEANKDIQIYFGGTINAQDDYSYYLAFADKFNTVDYSVKKKYHFDIISPNNKHPRYHLQSPGELSEYLKNKFCNESYKKKFHPDISQPRIAFYPMTLGLLINYIFLEFFHEKKDMIITDSYWRGHIKNCEKFIFDHYYKEIYALLNDDNRKELLFNDWYYGI